MGLKAQRLSFLGFEGPGVLYPTIAHTAATSLRGGAEHAGVFAAELGRAFISYQIGGRRGGIVRNNAEINKHIAAQTALGRVGLPDDIGPMIAALLSDENRWVTAQRIEVSGGMFL